MTHIFHTFIRVKIFPYISKTNISNNNKKDNNNLEILSTNYIEKTNGKYNTWICKVNLKQKQIDIKLVHSISDMYLQSL